MKVMSWIKHLLKRRGTKFFNQMFRMWRFHQTSFNEILHNIFSQLEEYNAKFTFPTIASVVPNHPDEIKSILKERHELANHGYKHIKYSLLDEDVLRKEFQQSTTIFDKYNLPIRGFRAPYNSYNEATIRLVEEFGFEWDGGIGYRKELRSKSTMFKYQFKKNQSSFWTIPLHRFSDDLLIDRYGMDADEMVRALSPPVKTIAKKGGVLMFDLHPIRIGQPNYAPVLGELAELTQSLGGWMPTVSEATDQWEKHRSWPNGKSFCLLLTGDIDNFVFLDYLKRIR